jgi:putative oxidoreductase
MTQPVRSQITDVNPLQSTGKWKNIVLWVIQILLAGMFILAGWAKLTGAPVMVQMYDAIGVGQWFRYVTGTIEVGSGLLILVPGMAAIAAVLLSCTMIGAIITHFSVLHTPPTMPVVLLTGAAIVLWGRWSQIARRLGRTA